MTMSTSGPKKRFRVALSFPGAECDYVKRVAELLALRFGEAAVLYDRFHTAEFAQPDLAFDLPNLYRNESDLIVVVLCGEYVEREWCGLEWRAIYALIKEGRAKQVMLFRADTTEIRGLHGLEGFVPTDAFTPDEAATLILQRLAINEGKERDFYLDGGKGSTKSADFQTAASKLPKKHDSGVFEGREKVLADLDALWADAMAAKAGRARIVSLVAIGGAGKTTVASRWKDALLACEDHGGVERYFDWSFYSQGTREGDKAAAQTAADATVFVAAALTFFGDQTLADSPASAWDKGARLAALAAQHRTLLILDGLEPLQHPPGPQQGELKDDAIRALFAGLQSNGRGLCVVTTREPIADLAATRDTSTPEWRLDHLTAAAGALVLKRLGVTGPEAELQRASAEIKGHALTLSLMGRYLRLAFDPPDIARRDCFHFSEADAETQNGHAFRVFAAYERWLEREGRHVELAILQLLGLFDRPATPDCLTALCAAPVIPGLTEPLVGLGEKQWNIAVQRLRELDLIETVEWSPLRVSGFGEKEARAEMAAGEQGRTTNLSPPQPFETHHSPLITHHSIDAHPLLREYFESQLKLRGSAPAAHACLFGYLCAAVPFWPEGRDGLLPLYQAVAHACKARRIGEALSVFRVRICRGTAGSYCFYSRKKLGLHGLNLAAVACFYVEPWRQLAAELTSGQQAWLLNEAALGLRALNRLTEAREPMRAGMELSVQHEAWRNAAWGASNLSELELTLGDVRAAQATAARSVAFGDRSGLAFERIAFRTTHANALHEAGQLEAGALFVEAEAMQAEHQPRYRLLYALQGYWYCDLLLAAAERAAWRRSAGFQSACFSGVSAGEWARRLPPKLAAETAALLSDLASIEQRAAKLFEWRVPSDSLLTIALDHLTLGRVQLLRAIPQSLNTLPSARTNLDTALATLRQAGQAQYLPPALLPCAWVEALLGEWDTTRQRLEEAFAIATRGGNPQKGWVGGMRLHIIDTLLHRARLFGIRSAVWNPPPKYPWPGRTPQADLDEAAALIDVCGYHRRDAELADARAALGSRQS